ncbi:phosphoenolpyruvate carboxykinase [Actinoallomurus purpureus]|uniref:phosphoenolpyruvate carboxykinase n=1 Tax=Actinoallomurus purpureus TaxID=478114 RepID=UPI0020930971|nr:phosphoenolpyruvate carboxykinase [Actinoallomurus purpureus]MCO6006671.1 phosphoenolpyruvate carboxykinase [Actinoallomurus purpureus]
MAYEVKARSVEWNPTAARLRELTEKMPNSQVTEFGNVVVKARVDSRSAKSTYIVDDSTNSTKQTITRAEYDRVAGAQDTYLAGRDVVVVDGYIGSDRGFRTRARLVIEASNANIAGMQKQLYYPVEDTYDPATWDPDTTVVYTPNLPMEGYPNDRLIAVDLDSDITRVFNSDYFGESKKGGLRMWNNIVYERGGLSLHAGCKVIPVGGENKTVLIVGLSGTGKTTTTFTTQLGSKPVQDDFIALMPGGRVHTTENGCFAKTFGLDPEFEPTIYNATVKPDAYLENVSVDADGKVDFFDTSCTKNGRTTWPFKYVDPWPADQVEPAEFLLILNRNENIVPGVARLDRAQAAAYFMLGETTGTSAGGKDEEGKFLRVPGTNPFFPRDMADMGNRMLELLDSHEMKVFVLNTGRVGGGEGDDRAKKVKIPHSSAIVQAIVEGTIEWEDDPDFGYEIASSLPGIDDIEILQPRRLYERQGRMEEYDAMVGRLKAERREYLSSFTGLDEAIVKSIG